MVDIEPMLEYDFSHIGIKNIFDILTIMYITFVYPIYVILNYNIKTEKKCIKELVDVFISFAKPTIYKVSKEDINIEKNIMYMSNHLSISDFFIEPLVSHYNSKYISLNKIRTIFPFLGLLTMLVKNCIFTSSGNSKEHVIANLKKIEEERTKYTSSNLALYPEGMRRPHRPYVSEKLKKGFIFHSFEHNIPIQIIHTTNKDYLVDDEKLRVNKHIKLFTYYSPLVDPIKLRKKFEKREKKEYTKYDYYNDFYKIWEKIWKRMDKYRIDSYRKQGMSYDDALQKIDEIVEKENKKLTIIENTIMGKDEEISNTFILVRNILWGVIYYSIYKIIGFIFDIIIKIKKNKCSPTNSIIGKILCLPKNCIPIPTPTSTDSISTMSNIVNQDVCSPECSPKQNMNTGFGLASCLLNL